MKIVINKLLASAALVVALFTIGTGAASAASNIKLNDKNVKKAHFYMGLSMSNLKSRKYRLAFAHAFLASTFSTKLYQACVNVKRSDSRRSVSLYNKYCARRKYLTLYSMALRARTVMGVANYHRGRYKLALANLDAVLRILPTNSFALEYKKKTLRKLKRK